MFDCFFPKPKLFFTSFVLWSCLCVVCWYLAFQDMGADHGLTHFPGIDSSASDLAAESQVLQDIHRIKINYWLYQYIFVCYVSFILFWMKFGRQPWAKWSVSGSGLVVFMTWFQVQVNVMINDWYGTFYDMIQKALEHPGSIAPESFYGELSSVFAIVMIAIAVAVFQRFFVSHWVFRWRTAMTEYYTAKWRDIRHIEGASQRIQEDTMRLAATIETLGVSLLDSVMTLIAFLPVLWGLSAYVKTLPLIGDVPQALVFVAILWSAFGTCLLAVVGIKLPGLEFNNQKVEAAYRKELVYGEDDINRGRPPTLQKLFDRVRKNYFRLYFHYVYFNITRFGYLQIGAFIPLVALAPSIVAGAFTLGIMQRIINAFGQVEGSFQYLVHSWTTVIELLSIYKRLKGFEFAMDQDPHSKPL